MIRLKTRTFNNLKYIKVVSIMMEESLFKIQGVMFAPERMDIRLVNTKESYKSSQDYSSETALQQE